MVKSKISLCSSLALVTLFASCEMLGLSKGKDVELRMGQLHASLAKCQGFEDPLVKSPIVFSQIGEKRYDSIFEQSAKMRAGQVVGLAWADAMNKRKGEGKSVEGMGNAAEMLLYFNECRLSVDKIQGDVKSLMSSASKDFSKDPAMVPSAQKGLERAQSHLTQFAEELPKTIEALEKVQGN